MKKLICCAFLLWSSPGFTTTNALKPMSQLPVWSLERDGRTSYIIGIPPANLKIKKLPAYYRDLIRSHPIFVTESSRARSNSGRSSEEMQSIVALRDHVLATLNGKNQSLKQYLPPEKVKYVKRVMRRIALTNTSRMKQIFIPGYAGIIGEAAANLSAFMPPLVLAGSVISAATGMGLGTGPTAEDMLLQMAEKEKRTIIPLKHAVDLPFLVKIIGPKQLQDVIDYVLTQQANNQPVALVPALERMMSSIDYNSAAELARLKYQEISDNVELVTKAHDDGGAVITMDLLGLVSQTGHIEFERLNREGFTITRINNGNHRAPDPCRLLLD